MFFKHSVQILDCITQHWMQYVILCDGRLLQKGGRKLIGVLRIASMLRGEEQFDELSLGSVYSHTFKTRLPAYFIKHNGVTMCAEMYIDPMESQDDKLRFCIAFSLHGVPIAERSVTWSSKKGPDLIHAYKLLEMVKGVIEERQALHQQAQAQSRLEKALADHSRRRSWTYMSTPRGYEVYCENQCVAVLTMFESNGSYITSLSSVPHRHKVRVPREVYSLDAMIV